MRRGPQPTSGVGPDQPNPGREGITRSKAIPGSRPWRRGSLSGPITSRYSATEPGQPWLSTSGSGSGSGERTCKKCTLVPSMIVVNCGCSLIRLSHARQSYRSRQCAASCWTNASETPYPWSPPRGSGAHRALSSRSRRSASSLSATPTLTARRSAPSAVRRGCASAVVRRGKMRQLIAPRAWLTVYQLPATRPSSTGRGGLVELETVAGQPHQGGPRSADRADQDPAQTDAIPARPHRRLHRQDRARPHAVVTSTIEDL